MDRFAGGLLGSLALALTICTSAASAQAAPDPVRVRMGGHAQVRFNTTSVDEEDVFPLIDPDDDIAASTFETRRVRVSVEAAIAGWITARIQPDFALGELDLADAWLNLEFDEAVQLRVGQFKKPFSLLFLTSSSLILPIERGVRIRGLDRALVREGVPLAVLGGAAVLGEEQEMLDALGYVGREIGVALHGERGRWGYAVGVFNGSGKDALDDNDGTSAAGRIQYRFAGAPARLGLAGSYRETRGRTLAGARRELEGVAVSLDGEWGDFFRPGLHVLGEAVLGENLVDGERLWGAQVWLASFFQLHGRRVEGIEPIFRLSYGNPSSVSDDDGWLVTPGVNVYLFRRNKLSVNWDAYVPRGRGADAQHALRAQAQVYF